MATEQNPNITVIPQISGQGANTAHVQDQVPDSSPVVPGATAPTTTENNTTSASTAQGSETSDMTQETVAVTQQPMRLPLPMQATKMKAILMQTSKIPKRT